MKEIDACPRCQNVFFCTPSDMANCHCSSVKMSGAERGFVASKYVGCLCNNCLHATKLDFAQMPLYFIENGYYVFTEKAHLNRGYCCKSGCRHCPYTRPEVANACKLVFP